MKGTVTEYIKYIIKEKLIIKHDTHNGRRREEKIMHRDNSKI